MNTVSKLCLFTLCIGTLVVTPVAINSFPRIVRVKRAVPVVLARNVVRRIVPIPRPIGLIRPIIHPMRLLPYRPTIVRAIPVVQPRLRPLVLGAAFRLPGSYFSGSIG